MLNAYSFLPNLPRCQQRSFTAASYVCGMKQSEQFLENAHNCAQLAEHAPDGPTYKRYKRMEAAWLALAEEQDWLDGEVPPTPCLSNREARKTPPP